MPKKKKEKEEELPPKVRKRGKGFTYRYEVPIIKPDGSPGRKQKDTRQFPTADDAHKAGMKIEVQLMEGTYVDEDNALFSDCSPRMLAYHAKLKKLRDSTVDTYTSLLSHADTFFAGKKIKDIKHGHYQDFLFWLQDEKDLAISSIRSIHALLSVMFKETVKRGHITASPCTGATVPRDEELDPDEDDLEEVPNYLEKDQLASVIKASKKIALECDDQREAFAWRQYCRVLFVMAHTGMRVGELGALEPHRVDAKKLTIKIAATLYDKRGLRNYSIGPPKTKESRRTIDISKRVSDVIEEQLKDVKVFKLLIGPKYYTDRNFVFVNPTAQLPGYPLKPKRVNDMLEVALTAAELPSKLITAHGLRHTYTSLSAEANVTLDDIQKQLGHSTDVMTKRVYLHVTQTRRKANVDKLDALLGDLL